MHPQKGSRKAVQRRESCKLSEPCRTAALDHTQTHKQRSALTCECGGDDVAQVLTAGAFQPQWNLLTQQHYACRFQQVHILGKGRKAETLNFRPFLLSTALKVFQALSELRHQ